MEFNYIYSFSFSISVAVLFISLFPLGSAPGTVWDHTPLSLCPCLVQTNFQS